MTDTNENDLHADENPESHEDHPRTPVYQKPILRKYDQIEQVKPYGPSELEAG